MVESSTFGVPDLDGGEIGLSTCVFGMGGIGKFQYGVIKRKPHRRPGPIGHLTALLVPSPESSRSCFLTSSINSSGSGSKGNGSATP